MIVTYFQCLTLRVRSGHLSNALTRERSWLTEKLVSPPYQSHSVVDSFTYYKKYPPVTPLWANSTTVRRPLDKRKPKDWFRQCFLFLLFYYFLFSFLLFYFLFILFYFQTQVARNKTSSYMVTKYPPVTPLWANSTTVRRPLDKMKPKDWFRHFFLF